MANLVKLETDDHNRLLVFKFDLEAIGKGCTVYKVSDLLSLRKRSAQLIISLTPLYLYTALCGDEPKHVQRQGRHNYPSILRC